MILNIIPTDLISPIMNGDALQVIFLGVCVGTAMLVLGDRVSSTRAIIEQANAIVQFLMGIISKIVPFFIFLSILSLMYSGVLAQVSGILRALVLTMCCFAVMTAAYMVILSVRHKVPLRVLFKKLLPTWLIAVSTASSATAFATNLETCEKDLGVPNRLVSFAVPLGQVLYMPAGVAAFIAISLSMAQNYGAAITPVWLITAIISSSLLAMATSPVPGGALTCYTILFSQLGIPAEALALAIAVDMLIDFFATATNLTCLQTEITLVAGRMDMLDENTLRREKRAK